MVFPISSKSLTQFLPSDFGANAAQSSSSSSSGMNALQAGADIHAILRSDASEEAKIQAIQQRTALAVADYYTGGMASKVFSWAHSHWGGSIDKLLDLQATFDPLVQICSHLFDTDRWKTEGNRLKGLLDTGVEIPESLRGAMNLTRGRTLEELVDPSMPQDFIGTKPDGTWVNNQFAATRDERYLKPEDIWGYATCFERFGNDWLGKFSEDQRRSICQKALDLGLVREHHGTIDIDWGRFPS